jgi:signal transduction histidine kinase
MNLFKEISETSAAKNTDHQITLRYLPDCASFMLNHKIREMAERQYQLSKELKIPLLRYFSKLPEDQIIALGEQDIRRVLTALEQNDVQNYMRLTVAAWVNNQIPEFSRNQLVSEDISLLSYIRRTVFREFVGTYSQDLEKVISLLEEMDRFLSWMDMAMFKTLFAIQQELHEQSQEIAHLGNWLWDLTSNRIIWSRELFRIYELEPTDYVTFDISLYNHPDDSDMVLEQMRISRETKQPHDFYYRIILPSGNGKYLHARGQVLLTEAGEVEKMYGTLQDVTSQKENERIRREYDNFIQKVTDLTPSLITVYNIKTGQYLFLNQALDTLLGYDPKLALTQGIEFFIGIIHPEDLPRVLDENNDALKILNEAKDLSKSDQIREFRYRLRHRNGEYRWFHTYGTIFERDKNSNIEKLINISNDITEQVANRSLLHQKTEEIVKQEERYSESLDSYTRQLEEKNRQLEEKNRELESFASIASHDLQEPLRKIKLWSNRLATSDLTPELIQSGLSKILTSTTKMQALIKGLLDYTQLDDMKSTTEQVDLSAVLHDVLDDFSERLEERQAAVTEVVLPILPAIPLQMQQLFANLISNSVKYAKSGIPLTITVGYTILDNGDRSRAKAHQITFADNGIGFRQDHAERIFEIFQRLHSSHNTGTGIGLAICKKIVENHGGSITASSEPGEGATFTILLPFQSHPI